MNKAQEDALEVIVAELNVIKDKIEAIKSNIEEQIDPDDEEDTEQSQTIETVETLDRAIVGIEDCITDLADAVAV